MTEVYSKNESEVIEKKYKHTLRLAIALPLIAFVLAVAFCFVVNTDTLSIFKAIGSTISVLCVWACVYLLFNRLPKLKNNASHINKMLNSERKHISFVVDKIEEPKTLVENIVAYEVYAKDMDVAFYYEVKNSDMPFEVGNHIEVEVVNNYIVAYEVRK